MAGETSKFFFVTPILREMIPIFSSWCPGSLYPGKLKTFALHEIPRLSTPSVRTYRATRLSPQKTMASKNTRFSQRLLVSYNKCF